MGEMYENWTDGMEGYLHSTDERSEDPLLREQEHQERDRSWEERDHDW